TVFSLPATAVQSGNSCFIHPHELFDDPQFNCAASVRTIELMKQSEELPTKAGIDITPCSA
uniref:hypothetical protein n=1 Tax=Candidatus Electrothrix sp. TaxID=2170559 RepID=UPI004056D5FA